uniref:Uncharacterized protein n=1 Tax=Haptolina ericina TaxID=156174 RepID=A0A7S3ERX0_9EUKA
MDELLKQPTMERHVPDVNAAVERYVANKRAKQETINEYLDCIEDFLSPAAPLQVAFNPSSSLADAAARSMNASPAPGGPTTQMLAATRPGGGESLLGPGIIKRDPMHHLAHDEVALPPAIAAIKSEALAALSPLPPPTPPVPVPAPAPAPVPAPAQQTSTAGASNGTSEGEGEGVPAAKRQRRETVGSQLLGALSQELGLTSPQVDALSGQKEFIKADREIVQQCIRLIKELRSRVSEHVKTSQGITDGLRRILTPVQVAKFLMWVEKHQKSMDMLNSMLAE